MSTTNDTVDVMTMSSLQESLRNTPAYSALRERLVTMINQDKGLNATDENQQVCASPPSPRPILQLLTLLSSYLTPKVYRKSP